VSFAEAPASYALILVTVAVSLYAFAERSFFEQFAFEVGAVRNRKQHYRIVTSSFLHGGAWHLLFNMITLFFFGPEVEKTLGRLGFLVVYFGAVIASGFVSLRVNRRDPAYTSIGASDGCSGIVLSYCCFYPMQPIYFMFLPFPIPAILYGALFIVISALMMDRANRVIAHEAHLAGALAGAFLTVLMEPGILFR
jgi:membrane associated rhomboid family serine protease